MGALGGGLVRHPKTGVQFLHSRAAGRERQGSVCKFYEASFCLHPLLARGFCGFPSKHVPARLLLPLHSPHPPGAKDHGRPQNPPVTLAIIMAGILVAFFFGGGGEKPLLPATKPSVGEG